MTTTAPFDPQTVPEVFGELVKAHDAKKDAEHVYNLAFQRAGNLIRTRHDTAEELSFPLVVKHGGHQYVITLHPEEHGGINWLRIYQVQAVVES
jgi:hypothetical protein